MLCPAFMAPGWYTAPGFFWKHHAYFPGCREASGAGAALVVRAAGRWDDAARCAARRSAAAVDTTMVHKGPGRPNAKIGNCWAGLHMMSFFVAVALAAVGIDAVRENARPAKHPRQYFLNCSAAVAALARTSDAAAHLSLETVGSITSSVSRDRLLGQRVLLQPQLERDGRPRWHRARIRAQKSHAGRHTLLTRASKSEWKSARASAYGLCINILKLKARLSIQFDSSSRGSCMLLVQHRPSKSEESDTRSRRRLAHRGPSRHPCDHRTSHQP